MEEREAIQTMEEAVSKLNIDEEHDKPKKGKMISFEFASFQKVILLLYHLVRLLPLLRFPEIDPPQEVFHHSKFHMMCICSMIFQ